MSLVQSFHPAILTTIVCLPGASLRFAVEFPIKLPSSDTSALAGLEDTFTAVLPPINLTELFRKVLRFISPLVRFIGAPFSGQCIALSRRTLRIATGPLRQKSEGKSLCEAPAACPKTKAFLQ